MPEIKELRLVAITNECLSLCPKQPSSKSDSRILLSDYPTYSDFMGTEGLGAASLGNQRRPSWIWRPAHEFSINFSTPVGAARLDNGFLP
jgi:hypothetical protein